MPGNVPPPTHTVAPLAETLPASPGQAPAGGTPLQSPGQPMPRPKRR